jgi:uridine kinase
VPTDAASPDDPGPRVRIVLLTGPSGSGKSHLAARSGLPTLCLDDFYRDGDDPALPRDAEGRIDWDDVRAWDADRALAALTALAATGQAELPIYDISQDRPVGTRHLDARHAPAVVAEGIFAAELATPCREAGVLADALCLTNGATRTFWRRLVRDLREGRKAPLTLLRRGWWLRGREPDIVARHVALGAEVVDGDTALRRIHAVLAPARQQRGRDRAA